MSDITTESRVDWPALLSRQIALQGRLLFRTAFGILKEATAAEDVVQMALLKAWERRAEIQQPELLKQWLVRAVVNGSFEVLRRKRTEARVMKLRVVAVNDEAPPGIEQLEARRQPLDALADLPEMSRSVVALRLLEGMSGNDVKDLLGCSAAEVSRQLHRGLEQLRGVLNASLAM